MLGGQAGPVSVSINYIEGDKYNTDYKGTISDVNIKYKIYTPGLSATSTVISIIHAENSHCITKR